MKQNYKQILISLSVFALLLPVSVSAREYDPDLILTDNEFGKFNSMSRSYIQEFLKEKGSELADLLIPTSDGNKRPADIFYEAAQAYEVNPKLLIATAQKEQSAITDGSLSDEQKSKLMGYGVYPGSDPSDFLGVENQINKAAWQFRRYYERHERYGFQKGQTRTTSDGYEVTPESKATAGLYNYTPYAGAPAGSNEGDVGNGGNFLFWKVWQDWFAYSRPSGSLIREEGAGGIYILRDDKKYPFWSREVFDAHKYSEETVVDISSEEMQSYPTVEPVKYPDGALIRSPHGTVYIIDHLTKRGFASREVFDGMGYNMKRVYDAPWRDINMYPEGESFQSVDDAFANGTLIKSPYNDAVFQVWDGKKRPFLHISVFNKWHYWDQVIDVTEEVFDSYKVGGPVLFKDGTLIRDESGHIYIIDHEKRRHIARPSVFAGFGYDMADVINVPDYVARAHEEGEILESF